MSAHIVVGRGIDERELLATLINILKEEYGIEHTTIQLEEAGYPKAVGEH
jgi:Co/Zn/Cd efflux system component